MVQSNISFEVEQRAFEAYFRMLGEFNNAFTGLEHMLTCAIKNTLSLQLKEGTDEWLINAIVGSMRMSPAKNTVKRILRVQNASKERLALVDKAFAQLGEIEWLRNRLAHNRTILRGTDERHSFVNYDFASATEATKSEFVAFQPDAIRCASEDLVAITKMMDDLISMHHGSKPVEELALPTWRYRPALLVRHRPKSNGNRKALRPQPQS